MGIEEGTEGRGGEGRVMKTFFPADIIIFELYLKVKETRHKKRFCGCIGTICVKVIVVIFVGYDNNLISLAAIHLFHGKFYFIRFESINP